MSQDQRAADYEIADAAVLVIVDIGSANSDRQNPDQDLAFGRLWNWTLLNSQIARGVQDGCGHRAVWSTRIAGHLDVDMVDSFWEILRGPSLANYRRNSCSKRACRNPGGIRRSGWVPTLLCARLVRCLGVRAG